MILATIAIVGWIVSEAYRDGKDILEKKYITNHTSRTTNRCMVGLIAACVDPWLGIVAALLFWVLFDTALNLFRRLPWSYIGTTADTDTFFSKNVQLYWLSKLLSFLAAAIILTRYGV